MYAIFILVYSMSIENLGPFYQIDNNGNNLAELKSLTNLSQGSLNSVATIIGKPYFSGDLRDRNSDTAVYRVLFEITRQLYRVTDSLEKKNDLANIFADSIDSKKSKNKK